MRIPEEVLSILTSKGTDKKYKFKDLYRNFYNPKFFIRAYSKIARNEGSMTAGTDGNTTDGMSLKRIDNLICQLKDESYSPSPSRREYIDKKSGNGKRPLGIPSFDDKLVQEVARMILESIYEPVFHETSHGFRPNKSCHTALENISQNFWSVGWFVEGDIKGFFDNIDHQILISILRKKIQDERFIRLIWKFLKAGYVENWMFHKTYSGTPQGGVISPILANVYLNELDDYMDEFKSEFNKGKQRKILAKYSSLNSLVCYHSKILKNTIDETKRHSRIHKIKQLVRERRTFPSVDPLDTKFKRIVYVRYADDFLVGIIGSKNDAENIKQQIKLFLEDKLKLELSDQKTLITNAKKRAKFLGYEIVINQSDDVRIIGNINGVKKRSASGKVKLLVPKDAIKNKLLNLRAMVIRDDGTYRSMHRGYLVPFVPLEVLMSFNAEIRGLYNYYQLANNVSNELGNFHHIMEYSLYKTLACKFKTSVKKIVDKYHINKRFGIRYNTKQGEKIMFLNERSYKMKIVASKTNSLVDPLPNTSIYTGRNSYEDALLAIKCDWCGIEDVPIEVHHVRKLKDLKGKKRWEINMIARKRKKLAMCETCHDKLHAGKLD